MPILDTYDTITLQGIVKGGDRFTPYLTNFFCGMIVTFDTEEVAFDKIFENNRLAPYVSPLVAGKVNKKEGYNTTKYSVPYIKDLDQVTPADGVKRSAGEAFGGSSSPAARIAAERVRLLARHDKRLAMRVEEQVSQLIRGGKILCEGEGHPSVEVDFGMSAANDITITGAARWNTLDPTSAVDGQQVLDDLESWAENSNESTSHVLMEKSVWKTFSAFKAVKDLRDTQVRGETSSFSVAPSNNYEHVSYKGSVGSFEIWVYTGYYRDDAGTKVPFLDTGRLVISSKKPQGAVAYGGIKDVHEMRSMRQFSKNWISEDPSAENLMSQSAPLAALPDIDSIVTVQTDGGA